MLKGKNTLSMLIAMAAASMKAAAGFNFGYSGLRTGSKYAPHQGKRECERRRRQIAAGWLKCEPVPGGAQ